MQLVVNQRDELVTSVGARLEQPVAGLARRSLELSLQRWKAVV
jgi:hypothetical protein